MMKTSVVVTSCENSLQNNEYGEYDKILLPIKEETTNECENIAFGEYGHSAFTESKVEIEETTLVEADATTVLTESAFLNIEENGERILSELQNNNTENVLFKRSSERQDFISYKLETRHIKDELNIQFPSETTVNGIGNSHGIEDKRHGDADIAAKVTFFQENPENIDKEHFLNTTLNSGRERSLIVSRSERSSDDNIDIDDYVPRSLNVTPHPKERTQQSNPQSNEIQQSTVGYNIEKYFVLIVLAEKTALCEEKVYEKILDTKEKLFVSLRQEDLYKLQEQCKDQSEPEENGKIQWHRWRSNQAKRYWCKLCPFTANNKCSLMVHIVKNHKELAAQKKYAPAECMTPGEDPNIIWYKCLECAYVTKVAHSHYLHSLRHKPHELETFSCAQCSFQTKWKDRLARHLNLHRAKYHKCIYCEFQTKYLKYMNTHVRMIHNTNEVELLKCKKCSFQTKYKKSLKGHALTHKEVRKMYKCHLCPYQTHSIGALKYTHMIRHKSDEEARKHKCEFCSYKAKTRYILNRHMLGHKSIDEVKMYKCDICPFQTRHKCYINEHRITHQAPDEDNMHQCNLCSYQGKTKKHLLVHQRNHRKPEECKMYKCEECPYQSRNTANLKRHRLQHKSIEELTLFQCHKCKYRGISKDRLRAHYNNVHRNPADIKWQKCNICDYQAKQPGNLKRHMLNHMDPNEVKKFNCDRCSFRAKTKQEVKAHRVMHSNVYLECDQCGYQAKFHNTLYRHRKQKHP